MFRLPILSALLSMAFATAAHAGARSLERAMETTAEAISLPETVPASIEARGCITCPSIRMTVPATAEFFIGKDPVTLKELRNFTLGKDYNMAIFYELDAYVVRRIVVFAQLPDSASTRPATPRPRASKPQFQRPTSR